MANSLVYWTQAVFNKGLMKSYTEILKEDDLKKMVDYLKSLSE
jgi:hypothetical protein